MKLAASDPKSFLPGDELFDKMLGAKAVFVRYDESHPEFTSFVKYHFRVETGIVPFRLTSFSLVRRAPEPDVTVNSLIEAAAARGDMKVIMPKQTRRGRKVHHGGHGFQVGHILREEDRGEWSPAFQTSTNPWAPINGWGPLWEVIEVLNDDFFVVRRHGRNGGRTPASRKTGKQRPKTPHQPKGRKFDFGA